MALEPEGVAPGARMTEAKPKPACRQCKARSSWKYLSEHDGLCGTCNSVAHLPDFDMGTAQWLMRKLKREGQDSTKRFAALKKAMKPPADDRYWAHAHRWHFLDETDASTRHLIGAPGWS